MPCTSKAAFYVCCTCGEPVTTPKARRAHTRATGCNKWKRVGVTATLEEWRQAWDSAKETRRGV